MEIWFNPSCSKCRTAKSILDEAGAEYTVRRYLDDPPTTHELEDLLKRLNLDPWDIVRNGEEAYKRLELKSWPRDAANRIRWIQVLVENPKLIQRPIITVADRAVVARTDEAVRSVLA